MTRILATILAAAIMLAAGAAALAPRAVFPKPADPVIRGCERWDLLVLKFVEGSAVRLRDGRLTAARDVDLTEVEEVLAAYPGTRLERLFRRSETAYEVEKARAEAATGRQIADLNLYFAVGPADPASAEHLLAALNRIPIVECVYPEPIPEVASIRLPDWQRLPPSYVDDQEYLEDSPIGVDAYAAWPHPGGKGQNVKMIDVELGWNWSHADLPAPFYTAGTPSSGYADHGTAVLGEIAGLENGFGVTGIAPQTALGGVAIDLDDYPSNLANWFDNASNALDPGDVWLIELHAQGPGAGYVCMEWWQGNFDAIANSTGNGRICVEAGGNGSENLDHSIYQGKFDRTVRDSLAILVGAGTPTQMQPEWFTNYGSRMDANGWGSLIYTTGYGDLYSGEGVNYYYTAEFGGTSGASPMVVGVCCAAQSIYKELTGGEVLDPETLRAAITETGAPQPAPVTQYIGPRPNIEELLLHPIFEVHGVYLDRTAYRCQDELGLLVRDETASGSVTITVASETEPAGEQVVLAQSEPGKFEGTLPTSDIPPQAGDGVLSVADGDDVTATYSPLSSTDTAPIDCVAPEITGLAAENFTDTTVEIVWTTDEPATSCVHYGYPDPDLSVTDSDLTTDHRLRIEGLSECTGYFYYVECSDEAGNVGIDDAGGNNYWLVTWERVVVLEAPLDTNPGWTTEGQWAWGQPSGGGGQYGNPDPTSGYTGANVYGYNLAGDYPNSMTSTLYLTTPAFDCSAEESVLLAFYRWLGVEQPQYDHASVQVSGNGGSTWQTIWENPGTLDGGGWERIEYDISAAAAGQANVKVRWGMGPTDSAWQYCGWNIDDVLVSALRPCDEPPASPTPAPTATPTSTSTPTAPPATATPTPSATPTATATPDEPWLSLTMPDQHLTPGEAFLLERAAGNPGPGALAVDEYLVLDVLGEYWWYPSWTQAIENVTWTLDPGEGYSDEILAFTWPTGAGSLEGVRFWGAFLAAGSSSDLITYSMVEWGFGTD